MSALGWMQCLLLRLLARLSLVFCAVAFGAGVSQAADDRTAEPVGRFELRSLDGRDCSSDEFSDRPATVLIFLGTQCPLAQRYAPKLSELSRRYAPQQVAFFAVASNRQDTPEELGRFAQIYGLSLPVLHDVENRLADLLGAERTPEVFIVDRDRRVRYRGRIDDQMGIGYKRPQAEHNFVAEALDDLLAQRPVRTPRSEAVGCLIGRQRTPDADSPVTWSDQIVRIFQRRCQDCHRPNEIAPFSLLSYDDALGWEAMIEEVVRQERMPPWHASPQYGKFLNDKRLTTEEKELIYEWVRRGAPLGDTAKLPPPREFPDGWPIGQPDEVIYMAQRPYEVPAGGRAEYQYFFVDPGFQTDKWVKWSWCRPDNRSVVHHINVYFRPPWESWNDWLGGMVNLISGYLPGQTIPERPFDGTAIHIPAGSELLFEMHYTPNGPGQFDRSSLGLVYADPADVTREAYHAAAFNSTFAIPPLAAEYPVEAQFQTTQDVRLEFLSPHMHLRGKTFFYEARYPNGTSEPLLDVQGYDYDWQTVYWLAEPKLLPLGTRVFCRATFDNSPRNLRNPDPNATVRWSGYTEDEMMVGVLGVSVPISKRQTVGMQDRAAPVQRAAYSPQAPISPGDKAVDRAIFLQNRREFPAVRAHLREAAAFYRQERSQGGAGWAPYRGLVRVGWLKLVNFVRYYRHWLAGYLLAINGAMLLVLGYDRLAAARDWRRAPLGVQRIAALLGGSPAAGLMRYVPWPKRIARNGPKLWPIVATQLAVCGVCLWLVLQTQ